MTLAIRVEESELAEVIAWSEEHVEGETTDHEGGTYEEGVRDALMWALGYISNRPDL